MRSYVCTLGKLFTIVRAAPRALRCPKRDRADCGMEHRSAATRANDLEVPRTRSFAPRRNATRTAWTKKEANAYFPLLSLSLFRFLLSDITYFVKLFVACCLSSIILSPL